MSLLPEVERALTGAIAGATAAPRAGDPRRETGRGVRAWPRRAVALALAVALGAATTAAAAAGVLRSIEDAVRGGERPLAPQAQRALPVLGSGGTRSLAAYRGRTLVVSFYASWCWPCRAQARRVDAAGARLRAAGAGTAVLIGFRDRAGGVAERFAMRYGLHLATLEDRDGSVARAYGVRAIPVTFVIDAAGRVVAALDGSRDRAALDAAIARARR